MVGLTVTLGLSTAVSKVAVNCRAFCMGNKSLYLHIMESYVVKLHSLRGEHLIQHQVNSQHFPNSP